MQKLNIDLKKRKHNGLTDLDNKRQNKERDN